MKEQYRPKREDHGMIFTPEYQKWLEKIQKGKEKKKRVVFNPKG